MSNMLDFVAEHLPAHVEKTGQSIPQVARAAGVEHWWLQKFIAGVRDPSKAIVDPGVIKIEALYVYLSEQQRKERDEEAVRRVVTGKRRGIA